MEDVLTDPYEKDPPKKKFFFKFLLLLVNTNLVKSEFYIVTAMEVM